ncbi:MAG: hypothetical protein ACOYM3_21410 [Terrimicrobiaceae bacterium]
MTATNPPLSVHIPVGIVAFGLSIFLAAQIMATNQNGQTLRWQSGNLKTQLTNLETAEKSFADSIKQRDAVVQQADQVKAQYTTLLTDLLELAKTDADAKRVVEKYRIQNQAPAAAATPAASPSPSPAAK